MVLSAVDTTSVSSAAISEPMPVNATTQPVRLSPFFCNVCELIVCRLRGRIPGAPPESPRLFQGRDPSQPPNSSLVPTGPDARWGYAGRRHDRWRGRLGAEEILMHPEHDQWPEREAWLTAAIG